MSIPQNKPQYPWKPPSYDWRGTWPAGSGPGFPNSFPQPPPMPPGFAYGNRAWVNGRWVVAPMGGPHQPGRPGRKPGSDEYWATELVDNPLGLENMIPADQLQPEAPKTNGQSQAPNNTNDHSNMVWVPALTDEHPRGRIHHRVPSNGSRSSSQPTRRETKESSPPPPLPVPPLTPYRPGADIYRMEPPSARTRPQSSAGHRRHVEDVFGRDRQRTGRMSVPPGRDRYGSVPWTFAPSAKAAPQAQRPPIDSDSDTTSTQRPQSRSMSQTRSYTLPPEDGRRRNQTPDFYATYGRRGSASAAGNRAIQRSQTMPPELSYPMPSHVQTPTGARGQSPMHDAHQQRHEYSSRNIHGPQRDANNAPFGFAPRMPTPEPEEGEYEAPDPASVDRVRKWLAKNETINRASPTVRRTVDVYENDLRGARSPPVMQPYAARRVEDVTRSASLPAVIPDSGHRTVFNTHPAGLSDEPGEIAHGLAAATLNDNDYVGPNEFASRGKVPQRTDTLIIEDNDHRETLLPSPRSLNHTNAFPSRGVGGRSSFDQGLGPQTSLQPSPRHSFTSGGSHSRHVSPANSMQFQQANAGSSKLNYSTPPITPNRANHPHYQDPRGPYNMPSASGSRTNVTASTSNSPRTTPYRHVDPLNQRSPSVQPSPSSYQQPNRYRQHVYQHEGGSSSSLSLSNNGVGRHPSQRQQAAPPQNYHPDGEHVYSSHRANGKGRSSEELRTTSPQVDVHRAHLQMQQQQQPAYTRPTSHHSTPAKGAMPPTSSPSYGRVQLHNRRHGTPSGEKRAPRNVRYGLWNRRGDHLTEDGYVVYCPPGRNFPRDLSDYPESIFMDHTGKIVNEKPNSHQEHPDSIPSGARPPVKPYDMFIDYVLVDV